MERIQDWNLNQGPKDEDGKIQEGWENTKRIGRYKKYWRIQALW